MTLEELKEVFFGGHKEDLDTNLLYEWTLEKRELNKKENFPRPKRRQIWWCAIGKNVGSEQSCEVGFERPVLVLRVFGSMFLGLPITSSDVNGKKAKNPVYYKLDDIKYLSNEGKDKTLHGFVAMHQLKSFDSRRLKRKVLKMNLEDFEKIVTELKEII